jgi:hypothetical protein
VADLYKRAQRFGLHIARGIPGDTKGVGYWIAWYAGRRAAGAVLDAAKKAGVTDEQYEAMRKVAAEVAYD